MKLSILIPTIDGREEMLNRLIDILDLQMYKFPPYNYLVQIMVLKDNKEKSIGAKRNELLKNATGKYVAFVDDDDEIADNYIELLMKAIDSDCDCASLKGRYYVDGRFDGVFEHSIKYKVWRTTNNEVKYERFPNHLNCIKASIAKQFKFPEINHGEDHKWAEQMHKSGLIKTEFYISEILYHYKKVTKNV